MFSNKKAAVYITKNKIWAGYFDKNEPKMVETAWDGIDMASSIAQIKEKLGVNNIRVLLGNDLSYVLILYAKQEDLTEEKILSSAQDFIPEDLNNGNFVWKVVGEREGTKIVQAFAMPWSVLNNLSFHSANNKIKIDVIYPVSIVLANIVKAKEPFIVIWSGQEVLALITYLGATYMVEEVSQEADKKVQELTQFSQTRLRLPVKKIENISFDPMKEFVAESILQMNPIENPKNPTQKGFTLIEMLVVIAIIAILAVLVFVSLDPVTRFADARNSRRWSDVNSLLTANHEYIIDNDGILPTGVTTTEQQLGTCTSGGNTVCIGAAAACLDLSSTLAKYLKSIPLDPKDGAAATTYYSVVADANNIITISACNAELTETIQVSR